MYKAAIFDFGGVFSDSPFHAVETYGRSIGCAEGQISQIVFGSYGIDGDHPWHRVERGEVTLEETREAVLQLGREQGLEVDIYQVFGAMAESGGGFRPDMQAFVAELREQGLRTAIITNNVREFKDGWRGMFTEPAEQLFELIVDSSEVGVRKPEAAIFELCLQRLELLPDQCLFLDDFEANVAAANSLGISGVLVPDNYHTAIDATRKLLLDRSSQ